MALSGTISNSTTLTGRTYIIEWSATQSVANNTSTITCVHKLKNNSSYSLNISSRTNSCTVGSDEQSYTSSSINTSGGSTITLGTTTHTIAHDSDGTKSVTITGTFNIKATLSGVYKSKVTATGTVTLNTIPRASTITSAGNITLGNACSIKWTPNSTSFKYKIKFSIGSWSYTTGFISPATTSAYTYTGYTISGTTTANSTTIYAQLPSSTSGTMTAVLTTYNSSGTAIGSTSSKTFTVTIPSSVVPSIGTITLDPANITTVDGTSRNVLVKGKNKLSIKASGCAAGTGSTIKSYTFSGPSVSSTTKSSTSTSYTFTSAGTISSTGTLTYTVKITDARGRAASKTATITCYDYDSPIFTSFTAYRCNSSGTASEDGTYIKYSFTVSYSSVNSTNKSTVAIYYKKNTSSSWTSAANALTNSTTKTASAIIQNTSGTAISSFTIDSTYSVYAIVTDNYGGSTNSSTITVFGASRILNIRSTGTGIAFGKLAESDNLFECKWPVKMDDKITFGSGVQGSLYTDQNSDGTNIVYLTTGQNTSAGAGAGLSIHTTSVYVPNASNSGVVNLGSSGRKWNQLYAANATISTSDRNVKTDITNMSNVQEQLFNKLQPVTFKFTNGTSDRTHYGFISQDVEESLSELKLTGKDFAGFCKDLRVDDDGEPILDEGGNMIYDYSLRYSEFIALNTYMIQKLQSKISELETEIEDLKSTTQN